MKEQIAINLLWCIALLSLKILIILSIAFFLSTTTIHDCLIFAAHSLLHYVKYYAKNV